MSSTQRTQVYNSLQKILRRSDKVVDPLQLVATFTDAGFLFSKLSSLENQILYGRRGTGKTHALMYLMEKNKSDNEQTILIDMRRIGSDGQVFSDDSYSLQQKASRLVVETIKAFHEELRTLILSDTEKYNGHNSLLLLDELLNAITKTQIIGEVERNLAYRVNSTSTAKHELSVSFIQPKLAGLFEDTESKQEGIETARLEKGIEKPYLQIRNISRIIEDLIKALGLKRLWLLIDEWSDIPQLLQPYLAELIKKIFIPTRNLTVKIAAIEHRSKFRTKLMNGEFIGMELGADIMAEINLDDFLVFENNMERSTHFFQKLFFNHLKSNMREAGQTDFIPFTSDDMIGLCFTSKDTFQELARASEGVPRDAINILGFAVQFALEDKISIQHVRDASKRWYETDKLNPIGSEERASKMLVWIFEEVIGRKRAKAFLLESGIQCKEIDYLFDHRILHVLKRSISAQDIPGKRFIVYGIDYGCYVDLLATNKKPLGLLISDVEDHGEATYLDVPKNDMRSIRRSILRIEEFEKWIKSLDGGAV